MFSFRLVRILSEYQKGLGRCGVVCDEHPLPCQEATASVFVPAI